MAKSRGLREAHSGLPVPLSSLLKKNNLPSLLRVCYEKDHLRWSVLFGTDTLEWHSPLFSPHWMKKNLQILLGVRTWNPGTSPYKNIEILLPIAPRPQTPEDTLWKLNNPWLEGFVLPWVKTLRLTPGKITAVGMELRYFRSGKIQYERISLYIQANEDLPFDEKVYQLRISQMGANFRSYFLRALTTLPAYAYVIRIQDYYPSFVEEARTWMKLLRERKEFPLPAQLILEHDEGRAPLPQ
ncbi:MAG: hypothetical protein RMK19_03445 [Bacteroidia bacterium]|nr:hypothetical protein [Bacteroidia bacterium]MDW8015045.1 hypothetical protein [Bacteroidia bacterium]